MSWEGGGAARNPFSAARFAPGALPWIGDDVEELAARALVPGARHQILGPHGSGKSTLLIELERRARRAGWSVARARGSRGVGGLRGAALWLVDEYEELSVWDRARVRWRMARTALVVTAHADVGLPTLCRREVGAEVALALVERLAHGTDFPIPCRAALAEALGRHGGNLREVLFELYDRVEQNTANERRARAAVDARR